MICTRCKVAPSDGWPDSRPGDGELCQDCWETECSESWWRMMGASEDAEP